MNTSIYQKLLGDQFTQLKPALQFAHGSTSFVKAVGTIDVAYGNNFMVGWLNNLTHMPPKGMNQEIVLTIDRLEQEETWKRHFKTRIFSTLQFAKNGLLYEKSGPITLAFQAMEKEGALWLEQKKTIFAGIPLPRFAGVKTIAISTGIENGWQVQVEVRSPILGLMLKYKGTVRIQNTQGKSS